MTPDVSCRSETRVLICRYMCGTCGLESYRNWVAHQRHYEHHIRDWGD